MPELPEVDVLVHHLAPLLKNQTIRAVQVQRPKVIAPLSARRFSLALQGATFTALTRRGKYLLFILQPLGRRSDLLLIGHLGMTGRMYLLPCDQPPPKHAAVILFLGARKFVFEDTRYFGRLTFDAGALSRLGPEPLGEEFTPESFARELKRSAQAIKVKLLDQRLVAGLGNIYASEALFRAGISPRLAARSLSLAQVQRLWRAARAVLRDAIRLGSTVPLDWTGTGRRDGLFYYGRATDALDFYEERLRVYDREGQPCRECGASIRRLVQAARSTFFCPQCQRS